MAWSAIFVPFNDSHHKDKLSCVAGAGSNGHKKERGAREKHARGEGIACLSRAPRCFLCRYVQAPTTQVKPEDKSVIKKTVTEACEINTLKRGLPKSNDATATRTWLKSEFAL